MEIFNQMVELLEATREDVDKFYDKQNKSAGTRVRKAMQEIKKLAQDLRVDITETNKQ